MTDKAKLMEAQFQSRMYMYVSVCVCVYLSVSMHVCACATGLKLKHLLPSTLIPSVEMGFKQTNNLAENQLAPTGGTFKINK